MRSHSRQPDREFRPLPHVLWMGLVWLLMTITVAGYLLFVQRNIWQPPLTWWWLTGVASGLATLAAAYALFRSLRLGTRRTWSLAIFMLTLTPLVWLACFVGSSMSKFDRRDDIKLSQPLRALGLWAGNYFEVAAYWRYPRISEGQYVRLFDNGQPQQVAWLIDQMDRHVEEMANRLQIEVPYQKICWVRGNLSGLSNRAIGAWAICGSAADPTDLGYPDRHEVAHCLISLSCPVQQDMPMLLAEGWAQSQSVPRPTAILSLLQEQQAGTHVALSDLVQGSAYGQSRDTAYSHGAAFTWYLLEKFGGPKFLELYGQVRRSTFQSDVQDILGISFADLESDFWAWLHRQQDSAQQAALEAGLARPVFRIEREEDLPRWQQIRESRRQVAQNSPPASAAFRAIVRQPGLPYTLNLVIEKNSAWILQDFPPHTRSDRCHLLTPTVRADLVSGTDAGWAPDPDMERDMEGDEISLARELQSLRQFWFAAHDPSNAFLVDILDPGLGASWFQHLIHSIEPGEDPETPWTIRFSTVFEEEPDRQERGLLLVDPQQHFELVSMETESTGGSTEKVTFQTREVFGTRMVTGWHRQTDAAEDAEMELRALTESEISSLKSQVETAAASASRPIWERQSGQGNRRVMQPWTLAIAWPTLAVVLLAIDLAGEHIRIRVVPPAEPRSAEPEIQENGDAP